MTDVDTINERLELYYGRELDGRQRYRVVWSTTQIERRVGEFNEFYGQIYLRTYIGIKDVPKYPWDKDRWVIEKLFYIPNKEIISERPGSYEPILILKDKFGQFLPLNWKVVDTAVSFAEGKPTGITLTDADWSRMEQEEMDSEAQYFEDVLNEQGRNWGNQTDAFVAPVFIDSTKIFR